jgi:hypothetical protein
VPYVYDPALDEPDEDGPHDDPNDDTFNSSVFPVRGVLNVGVLLILILALLSLFIVYPVISYYYDQAQKNVIAGNVLVNGTGQVPFLCVPSLFILFAAVLFYFRVIWTT